MPGSAVLLEKTTKNYKKQEFTNTNTIQLTPNTFGTVRPRDVFCQRFDEALHHHDAGIREGREELNGDAVAFHGEESFHDSRVGHGVPTWSPFEVHLLQILDLFAYSLRFATKILKYVIWCSTLSRQARNSSPGLHDEGPEQTARPLFPANFFIFGETVFLQFFICALFLFSLLLPFWSFLLDFYSFFFCKVVALRLATATMYHAVVWSLTFKTCVCRQWCRLFCSSRSILLLLVS